MKTDLVLKQDIEDELRWDPRINEAHIGVTVDKGAVKLMGTVDTWAEKWAAEDAARRVFGVKAVKQELTVKLLPLHLRTDLEIKAAAESALLWDVFIPSGLTVKVADGRVTLAGSVTWNFQRESAERAVRYLMGVASVKNDISLSPQANTTQVKEKVAAALKRQATADSQSIHVETSGNKVTLSGNASSWQMIQDATSAAWAAPGVNEVVEHIGIR